MRLIIIISLIVISFQSYSQDSTRYSNLLIGKWTEIKDTRGFNKQDLKQEFNKNGKWIIYQNDKIIKKSNWVIVNSEIQKSKFCLKDEALSFGTPILKLTKTKLVLLYCECDIRNNFIKKNSYKITYKKIQ